MTEKALREARAYIDRSIRQQQRLGYKKPTVRATRSAVQDAAKAVDALLNLRARETKA
jgi:hypothetical protein